MKSLLKPLPEIDPIILLKEPYNLTESELAVTLGCSTYSIASWRYNRRQPQKSIKKLAAVVQKKIDKKLALTKVA